MNTPNISKKYNEINFPCISKIILNNRQKIVLIFILILFLSLIYFNFLNFNIFIIEQFTLFISIFLIILINISSFYQLIPLLIRFNPNTEIFSSKEFELSDNELPKYTILVPLYKESEIVKDTVKNLSLIDYPDDKLEIFFLIEHDDFETKVSLPKLPKKFSIVDIPYGVPLGKPRALNYGLKKATGEFLVIYDAEDIPDPYQLRNAAAVFHNYGDEIWAIQAKVKYNNPKTNWITLLFFAEYSYWYDLYLPYLKKHNYPVPLGGTSNHFRTEKLRTICGWDPFNVTEDADITLKIFKKGGKIGLLDSLTLERSPTKAKNWIKQRTRWVKGLIQTILSNSRGKQNIKLIKYYIFSLSGTFLVIYIIMLILIMSFSVNNKYYRLLNTICILGFIINILLNIIMYFHELKRTKIKTFHKLLFPGIIGYWILYLIANFRALYQLFTNPFYWDKTDHGSNG